MLSGELMTVTDALRHGFLDRSRKNFCNPRTRVVHSLSEAISNGWIHLKSNMEATIYNTVKSGFSYGQYMASVHKDTSSGSSC